VASTVTNLLYCINSYLIDSGQQNWMNALTVISERINALSKFQGTCVSIPMPKSMGTIKKRQRDHEIL